MYSLLLIFLSTLAFLLVAATPRGKCIVNGVCDPNPELMKAAIELIPDPGLLPQDRSFDAGAYRIPAIFETSVDKAQILVRVTMSRGLELTAETLMTKLWPHAKQMARDIYENCGHRSLCGFDHTVVEWDEPKTQKLGFQIEMACRLPKHMIPGVTTYTPTGVQGGLTLGGGSPINPWSNQSFDQ